MASTFTTRLRIEKIGSGEQSGSWGVTENTQRDLIDIALAGYLEIAMADANVTLTTANGATDQARYHIIKLTGTNTATRELIAPAVSKTYVIENGTTQSVSVKTSGGTAVTIPTGVTAYVFCDGTDFALASAYDSTQIQILNSVTPAADRLLYFTGASAGALATFTSFGRSLVDDADASAGRTTLGLGSLAVLSTINNSNWSGTALAVANGGTGSATAADARTALGLAIGTNVQAYSANLAAWSAVAPSSYTATGSDTTYAYRANNLSDLASASTARTNLGLGSLATLSAVNNSHWSGTALAVANGGTGATTAAAARSALGLEIGTNVQAFSDNLLAEAGLSASADTMSYYTAAGTKALTGLSSFIRTLLDDTTAATARATLGVSEGGTALQVASNLSDLNNVATARTNLGLGSLAVLNAVNNDNWSGTDLGVTNGGTGASDASTARSNLGLAIGTNVQAYSANLAAWSAVAPGSYTATGSDTTYAYRANNLSDLASASTARTNLGLGTAAVVNTGTSGATIPLLNGANTWSAAQSISNNVAFNVNETGGTARSAVKMDTSNNMEFGNANNNSEYIGASHAFSSAVGNFTIGGVTAVTVSDSQTLSNKTLSSPTLSGTVAGSPTLSGSYTFAGGHHRITQISTGTSPAASGSSLTDIILRVGASNVGGAGYGLDVGTSNATGQVWMQARDWSNYATNVAINLNPNGGGLTLGGVAVPTISSTSTLTNKTLTSPTLSGTVAGGVTWTGGQTFTGGVAISTNNLTFGNGALTTGGDVYASRGDGTGAVYLGGSSRYVYYNGSSYSMPGAGLDVNGSTAATAANTLTLTNKTLSSPTLSGTVAGAASWSATQTYAQGYGVYFANSGATHGILNYNNTTMIITHNTSDWETSVRLSTDLVAIYANGNVASWDGSTFAAAAFSASGVAIPTISSTDTLSNKTLASPTLSGTVAGGVTWSGAQIWRSAAGNYGGYFANDTATDQLGWFFSGTTGGAWKLLPRPAGVADTAREFGFDFTSLKWFFDEAPLVGGVAVPTISSADTLTNKQIRTPVSSETTGSLTSASANKSVACSGGITLANSVFTAGDMIALDPGTSARTITRGSGVTMYVNGTDVASATLAANKMGGVYWRSASVCVLSGAIS